MESTPRSTKPRDGVVDDSISSDEEICILPRKCINPFLERESSDDENENCSVPQVKRKPPKFVKTEDDNTPLPDPFPLPKHFRTDTRTSGKMTKATTSSFLSAITSAMLVIT